MSEKEVARGKIVVAAAGMLLYRYPQTGGLEILVGRRKNEPWRNYNSVVSGGLIKKNDESTLYAALRETHEETGGGLAIKMQYQFPIGSFGPKSYHLYLTFDEETRSIKAVKTSLLISDKYLFSMVVYAGMITGGEPRENEEVHDFRFVDPVEFAKSGSRCAFDQALALQIFYELYTHYDIFRNQRHLSWLTTPPV